MTFPKLVERWRDSAQTEIDAVNAPFPVEYVLAVMQVESQGKPGLISSAGAAGLMQVMPNTCKMYNKNNPSRRVQFDTLKSHAMTDGPAQIRVGLWVMMHYMRLGFQWITKTNPAPPINDIVQISDIMYVAGPGRVYKKFGKLSDRTFANCVSVDPDWQPFAHPRKVWKYSTDNGAQWDLPKLDAWLSKDETPPADTPQPPPNIAGTKNGLLLALAILAVASYYLHSQE